MSTLFEPLQTADIIWQEGRPFASAYNDIYFSRENGLKETHYVFIEGNRLLERWQARAEKESKPFVIAETGFGSGLSFLLVCALWLQHASKNDCLYFFSCEKHPLKYSDLARCLVLWPELKEVAEELLKNYPVLTPGFHSMNLFDGKIHLTLMLGDALDCYQQLLACGDGTIEQQLNITRVDAWFLDGFAPAKNPEMWHPDLLTIFGLLSHKGTTLATFSAAGEVKRGLESAGFEIKKIPGFGQKREMITAQFTGPSLSVKKRQTPWHISTPKKNQQKEALILGAGLAGCFTANALAKRGWQVILIDKQASVGEGASGVPQAVLYPNLSAYRSPLTEYMLMAYLHACRIYKKILTTHEIGELKGIIQLAFNEKEHKAQESMAAWLAHYPELGRLIDEEEAARLSGIPLTTRGFWLSNAGWMDSQALCRLLSNHSNIQFVGGLEVHELKFEKNVWVIEDHCAETLILANGYKAHQFKETDNLPFKSIRGQLTFVQSTDGSGQLKIPLCANGHVLPARNGKHLTGATYELGSEQTDLRVDEDHWNLARLAELPANLRWTNQAMASWSGVRGTTTDYLPVVGPVMDSNAFRQKFSAFSMNSKQWIPEPAPCFPGLYLCAGFGSRGLTTIPLSAEWLASWINKEPASLPKRLIQAISPGRFLYKEITRGRAKII